MFLVVGNGTSYCDGIEFRINSRTGNFLDNLNAEAIIFFQFFTDIRRKALLQDYHSERLGIEGVNISVKFKYIRSSLALFKLIRKSDKVYIFMPGNLGIIAALLCLIMNKDWGVYIRGNLSNIQSYLVEMSPVKVGVAPQAGWIVIRPMLSWYEVNTSRELSKSIDTKKLKYLYVGRLERSKGVHDLLRAFEILKGHHLTLVGEGPLREASGDRDNVCCKGPIFDRQRLINCYNEADVVIMPSYSEGFPRVIYEALLSSCVVVTTFVGYIDTVMVDKHNCIKIENNTPESIVNSIQRLQFVDFSRMKNEGHKVMNEVLSRKSHEVIVNECFNFNP